MKLRRSDVAYALRRTGHAFIRTRGIDTAAGLTFFSAVAPLSGSHSVVFVGVCEPSEELSSPPQPTRSSAKTTASANRAIRLRA